MKYLLSLVSVWCMLTVNAQKATVIKTDSPRDLIPEGITVDEQTGTFYVSSINQQSIIAFGSDGKSRPFVYPHQDGFLEGLGMKIDKARNCLWALSNKQDSNRYTNRIHAFDLKTRKVVFQYSQTDTVPHLFNDLVIASNGTLYISDTYFSAIYQLKPGNKAPEVLVKSSTLDYPNGMAFGKGMKLYIATYRNGLLQFDPTSKALAPLNGIKDTVISHGLDGLVYWKNSIIGIYNIGGDRSKNTVIEYELNPQGTAVIAEQIIEKGHPDFYEPTTAALAENKLYVLANSHLASYNANKESIVGITDKLKPVVVVIYNLQ